MEILLEFETSILSWPRSEGLQAAVLCIRFQDELQTLWLEELTFNQHYELQTAVMVVNN